MKITISFKNLPHSPAVDQRIKEKSQRLEKFFNGRVSLKWTCHFDDLNHYAEVVLYGPKFEYHAHSHSENLYKALDLVMEKLEKQIKKKKERWKNKIHHKHEEAPVIMDPEQAWAEYDEDYYEDVS